MWLPLFIFLPQTMRDLRIVHIDQKHGSLNLHRKTHRLVSGRTRVSPFPATHPMPPWPTTELEILCWISRGIWQSRWLLRTGIPREPVIHKLEVLVRQTRSTKLWIKSIRPWTAQKTTMVTQHSVHPPETMVPKEGLCSCKDHKKASRVFLVMQNPLHCQYPSLTGLRGHQLCRRTDLTILPLSHRDQDLVRVIPQDKILLTCHQPLRRPLLTTSRRLSLQPLLPQESPWKQTLIKNLKAVRRGS